MMTMLRTDVVQMIVDFGSVEWRDGEGRKEEASRSARGLANSLRMRPAPETSARIASRPEPDDGSSTRSVGTSNAAVRAARPKRDRR